MAVRGPSGRPFATGLPPASGIRLAGARARAVRSGQASEPSSAASLGKNGCGEPAATSLEPGGCGPTQPERAVAEGWRQARWYRGQPIVLVESSHESRVEPAA